MTSATHVTVANSVGVNPAEFSTVSTVSSCSNSNSNMSSHQGHHLQRQMQHLQPQTRAAYNSLPARKDVSKRASDSKSTGGDRSDINVGPIIITIYLIVISKISKRDYFDYRKPSALRNSLKKWPI